jgi:hypothetical protein
MHKRRVLGTVIGLRFWWMSLLLLLLAARVASADNIGVDCDDPMGPYGGNLQTAINSLNLSAAGHVITVTGTCMAGSGSFFISGARNLTIQAPEGQMALLQRPTAACDTPFPPSVLAIADSRVALRGLSIAGGSGVSAEMSTVTLLGDVDVANSRASGFNLSHSRLQVFGTTGNETHHNCIAGVGVNESSSFWGNIDGHHNDNSGIHVGAGSTANVSGGSVFDDNTIGIAVLNGGHAFVSGQTIIRSNGAVPQSHSLYGVRSGILVNFGGTLWVISPNGALIENNSGPGILADNNSTLYLTGATIRENPDGGVSLLHHSVAQFGEGNEVQGNARGPVGDLNCDRWSLAHGDLSGVDRVKCAHH